MLIPLSKRRALERITGLVSFIADYPGAIVVPAHASNFRTLSNTPKGWVLHTPEEAADDVEVTPYYFQTPNLSASTHYYLDNDGDVFQMVPERYSPIANGVLGKPYPKWADPNVSLNGQTLNVEIEGFAHNIAETLTPKQFNSLVALIKHRAAHYMIPLDREHIIGHYQVASNRSDPGAGFPWEMLIAVLNEEDEMKIAPWWTNRTLQPGRGEINLNVDFGPAKAYDIRIVMAPNSKGPMRFKHGDFKLAAEVLSGQRAASFMLVPGQFGTAPFEVDDPVTISYLACAGVIT